MVIHFTCTSFTKIHTHEFLQWQIIVLGCVQLMVYSWGPVTALSLSVNGTSCTWSQRQVSYSSRSLLPACCCHQKDVC